METPAGTHAESCLNIGSIWLSNIGVSNRITKSMKKLAPIMALSVLASLAAPPDAWSEEKQIGINPPIFVFPVARIRAFPQSNITYRLLPGSTITPYSGTTRIGPPEPVTGVFSWTPYSVNDQYVLFDARQLSFRSPSYSIDLHPVPTNEVNIAGPVYSGGDGVYLNLIVDAPGYISGQAQLQTAHTESTYVGPPRHPNVLRLPDLRLIPIGGGSSNFLALDITAAVPDFDHDGVPDDLDECPGTPAVAVVDAHGCSISQLAPCEGPELGRQWKNHNQYVLAVARAAATFQSAGLITAAERKSILREALSSNCGRR